jgi:hypothetical protein
MRLFILLIIVTFCKFNYAQEKIEIEKKIHEVDVPPKALNDLYDILGNDFKVKWYYQEDGDKKVFEAKFKLLEDNYSVEFDTAGTISNVEIEIKSENLEPKFVKRLKKTLNEHFDKNIIRKIQKEYYGQSEDLLEILLSQEIPKALVIQYEIEVIGKSGNEKQLFELILNRRLKLISKRQIKLKSTDIFDY